MRETRCVTGKTRASRIPFHTKPHKIPNIPKTLADTTFYAQIDLANPSSFEHAQSTNFVKNYLAETRVYASSFRITG